MWGRDADADLLIVTALQIALLLLELSDLLSELVCNINSLGQFHLPARLFSVEFVKSGLSCIEGRAEVTVLSREGGNRLFLVLHL